MPLSYFGFATIFINNFKQTCKLVYFAVPDGILVLICVRMSGKKMEFLQRIFYEVKFRNHVYSLFINFICRISQRKSEADDDEEVFIGPMGFREQCVAAVVSAEDQTIQPISPLGPEQYAELFKEANLVAYRLKNTKSGSQESNKSSSSLQISALSFKSSSSSSEGETSPANRRHSRGGTFTISKSPYELLTEKQKRTLPVVDKSDDTIKVSLDVQLTKDEDSNKDNMAVQSRLGVPKSSSKITRLSMNKMNVGKVGIRFFLSIFKTTVDHK